MNLIDTHTHLYCEEFDNDRTEVIQRATAAGISLMMLPAIDPSTYDRQQALTEQYPTLFKQMMGVHPTSIDAQYPTQLSIAHDRLYAHPEQYMGVGEIGLDFYWDCTYREEQITALKEQLLWAQQLHKPVSLHIRSKQDGPDAYATLFSVLKELNAPSWQGILHCFSGTLEQAAMGVELGFSLGIGGVVTYKKNTLREVVLALPLRHLVLETDAPYLAPTPYRGKRNESSYLPHIAQCIADIKEVHIEEVAAITTHNALQLLAIS